MIRFIQSDDTTMDPGLLHFIATKVVPSFADVACGEEKCDRET